MRPDKCVLGHLFRVLRVAQELVDHRIDPVPVARDHFLEGSLIPLLETIHKQPVQRHVLGFH